MTQPVPTSLHQLPAWLDVAAMSVGAAFGAHVARGRHVPLFGVLLAGVVRGLGGGIARDLLLGLEPAAIANWYYVPAVFAAAVIGGATARWLSFSPLPFVAAQAIALGLLIAIGVQKAVAYHTPAPSAILIGPGRSDNRRCDRRPAHQPTGRHHERGSMAVGAPCLRSRDLLAVHHLRRLLPGRGGHRPGGGRPPGDKRRSGSTGPASTSRPRPTLARVILTVVLASDHPIGMPSDAPRPSKISLGQSVSWGMTGITAEASRTTPAPSIAWTAVVADHPAPSHGDSHV